MMMTISETMNKRLLVGLAVMVFAASTFFGEDWILAARKFDFTQKKNHTTSEESFLEILPQLILEQTSFGLTRTTSNEEMLDRGLSSLLTERQSLFLQLSKLVSERDSCVLRNLTPKKLEKLLAKKNREIEEVEKQIRDNLEKTKILVDQYNERTGNGSEKKDSIIFSPFRKIFSHKEDVVLEETRNESVKFYCDDISQLYVPSSEIESCPTDSIEIENDCVEKKINAVIDGKITVLGNYMSVSCSLYVMPGKKLAGCVTEVGNVKDMISIARNIARYLSPVITNNLPVSLKFVLGPEECKKDTTLVLDGIAYNPVPDEVVVHTGKHTIKFDMEGYLTKSVEYEFSGSSSYEVRVEMEKYNPINVDLVLSDPIPGTLFLGSDIVFETGYGISKGSASVDGNSAIGVFQSLEHTVVKKEKEVKNEDGTVTTETVEEEGEPLTFFYYIPENLQEENVSLLVKGKPMDRASYIDKRRIWSYRAYTLFVISMPFTLFSIAKRNSCVVAYNERYIDNVDEINEWTKVKNICMGISAATFVFFAVELGRYLHAASSVLPENAVKAKPRDIEKSRDKTYSLFENPDEKKDDTEQSENK